MSPIPGTEQMPPAGSAAGAPVPGGAVAGRMTAVRNACG